jgi:hypothetical protein
MAGAPLNPEFITRGEFQNHIETVIKPAMEGLRELNRCVQANAKDTNAAISKIEKALEPLLQEAEARKDVERDNRLAIIGFATAIASTVISGLILLVVSVRP